MVLLTKAQIYYIKSVAEKKVREHNAVYIAEGLKCVQDILQNGGMAQQIYVTEPCSLENEIVIAPHQMEKISQLATPAKVLAIFKNKRQTVFNNNELAIVLDGLQDPGNMGTIIRTASWFGIKQIVCSIDCVDAYSFKSIQATMGAIQHVNVYKENLVLFLQKHKNVPIYATTLDGKSVTAIKGITQGIIVIGQEGKGIRPDVMALCNNYITIPNMGVTESLNAAVATAIVVSVIKL